MPILVMCDCGKRIRVGDEAAGKRARCSACQAVITVPAAVVPIPPALTPDLDDTPQPRSVRKSEVAASPSPPVEPPEDQPTNKRPHSDELDKADEGRSKRADDQPSRPRKKRSLAFKLGLYGCGGFLLLVLIGAGVIGYLAYTASQDADRVAGTWERDDPTANPSELLRKFPFTRLELDSNDKRFVGTIMLGASMSGRWHMARSPGDGLLGMNVTVTEMKGLGGKVEESKKEEVMGFHIRVIDADHLEVSAAGTKEWAKFRRSTGSAGPGGTESDELPPPVATLPADVLFKDGEKYHGKCVVVIARVPNSFTMNYPDGRVETTVDLRGDNGRSDTTGAFKKDDWAKVPKLEDGVRYEIMGLYEHRPQLGGKLTRCRFVGRSKSEAPEPVAKLTVQELIKDAAKYEGKLILVKGIVGVVNPSPTGGSVTLTTAGGDKFIVCLLTAEPFAVVLKAGRGAEIEVQGIATGTGIVTLNDCRVTKSQPANTLNFANFTGQFAENADKADVAFKGKPITLTAKVDSVGDGRITFTVPKTSKNKAAVGFSVVSAFSPDWKDRLAKVKAGDIVVVSGVYQSYKQREITLDDCWLVPR
jgi:hypothetical protein